MFAVEQAPDTPAVNDAPRMVLERREFHQPMRAVLVVQVKYSPDKYRSCYDSEDDAGEIIHAGQVENDYHNEHSQQASCKDEQVLRGKPFELDLLSNPLINSEFGHC